MRGRLTDDGVYVLNLVDTFPGGRLARALVRTLETEFTHVDAWLQQVPHEETRVTYVISATNAAAGRAVDGDRLRALTRPSRSWTRVTARLREHVGGIPVLTDDNAPVEQLISRLFTSRAGQ